MGTTVESKSTGSTIFGSLSLPYLLRHHALLGGSIGEDVGYEDPLEVLAAQVAARANYSPPPPPPDREDPAPGNTTGKFHGVCRSHFPPAIPNVTVHRIWKSQKLRRYTDVTLVTHLSIDKLPELERQCDHWMSVVSAAVFVNLPYTTMENDTSTYDPLTKEVGAAIAEAEKKIDELFQKIESGESQHCTLDTMLVFEHFSRFDPFLGLYPINALRNRALQMADTDIVLVIDVDLLPNADLAHDLHVVSRYETLRRVTEYKQVIVLPALEILSGDPAEENRWTRRALEGPDRIRTMTEKGKIQPYLEDRNPHSQGNTDFDRWINSSMPYRVDFIDEGYEPFFLAKRLLLPWFDGMCCVFIHAYHRYASHRLLCTHLTNSHCYLCVYSERFRGLRMNDRVIHTWHMYRSGFLFVTTPRAYLIHVKHPKSPVVKQTRTTGCSTRMQKVYNQSLLDVEADQYGPVTLFQCALRRGNKWSWYRSKKK